MLLFMNYQPFTLISLLVYLLVFPLFMIVMGILILLKAKTKKMMNAYFLGGCRFANRCTLSHIVFPRVGNSPRLGNAL